MRLEEAHTAGGGVGMLPAGGSCSLPTDLHDAPNSLTVLSLASTKRRVRRESNPGREQKL